MKTIATLAVLAASGLAIAACGSSSTSSTSSGSSGSTGAASSGGGYGGGYGAAKTTAASTAAGSGAKLALTADESGGLSFDHATLSAKAGKVTLVLANPSSNGLTHAIALQGPGAQGSGTPASPGGTSSLSVTLKPGTYTYFCPIDGHRQAGMQGTLTVK